MRKIIAVFISLALLFVLASCTGQQEETTTTLPSTQYTSSTVATTTQPTTEDDYVLTTSPEKTVPWEETTRFEFDATVPVASSSVGSSDYEIEFNVSDISKPNVNTSVVATSASTTAIADDNTTYAGATTYIEDEEDTTAADAVGVLIDVNSCATGEGILFLEINPSNWSEGFAAGTANVVLEIDGVECETTPTLTVPKKTNALGYYDCEIDISGLEIGEGSTITFKIPAGSIKNKSGTEYNLSYTGSCTK